MLVFPQRPISIVANYVDVFRWIVSDDFAEGALEVLRPTRKVVQLKVGVFRGDIELE